MTLTVYLSGEIHTDWREQIVSCAGGLDVTFDGPVTDHAASDDCGVAILGAEPDKFWHDRKGAQINAIRTRTLLQKADIVVVRFGDRYRQWPDQSQFSPSVWALFHGFGYQYRSLS